MDSAQQWVHEREAAELLALKHGTFRTMRRDRRLLPGDHYIFATGTAGGPVSYNVNAIRKSLAQRTKEIVGLKHSVVLLLSRNSRIPLRLSTMTSM